MAVSNVKSGTAGAVKLDIGPFRGVSSDAPLHHVFAQGLDGFEDEITLAYQARDEQGNQLQFEFAYIDGAQSIALAERGFLELTTNGAKRRAVAGSVDVQVVDRERLGLRFEGLRLVDDSGAETTLDSGSVAGLVERTCLVQSAQAADPGSGAQLVDRKADTDWKSDFCVSHVNHRP